VGRATAISFAKAGAAGIALGARSDFESLETEIQSAAKAAGKKVPKLLKIKLDVTSYKDVQAAAKETEEEFGKVDILINNAGYLSNFEPIGESDEDDYWRNYEINLRGVYWMTKAFLPLLLKSNEKTIVNLSSIGANGLRPGASGYQVTKFALLRFTEFTMADHGDQGILAYCVHPGGVLTDMGQKMPKETHVLLGDKAEVAADTMCFLTTERREWLAGRYISCTWDMLELLSRKDEIVNGNKLVQRMIV
jgi:NAD(P)-dependent dehydrogenase (short-subunit alcohol dehydrogenase family)